MQDEDHVPMLKKWSNWYWLLLAFLAVQIILFYSLTAVYR